jgi:uncharacterized low-complexity protein
MFRFINPMEISTMYKKTSMKPLAIAMGTAVVTALAGTPAAHAADNPFAMTELSAGYMVAENTPAQMPAEGKCGAGMKTEEGKCGGMKMGEGKCGEGKCGMQMMDTNSDGSVSKEEFMSGHETMFGKKDANGDGKIDASEMKGGCGADKMMEGKCGEGKCGAGMKKGAE